ncbi:respiratory nitrite reductase specific menaquinol--cytochrome-c reductase (NrfH) precursor [Malonomonas rubra DSM 5091]|uniref:Respiratory nitrite reductase specific menaquinol--cytochrome-c reductase (NrfH) n=2 Tax=Malonomonas rubra DSM 5091 TaxID=1122189 RepID=A0A1M6MZE7_MALRU|nr:cytochrome c nitrite reductase small subunit [Malonomonas rubra]SHJ88818.1 respiratory nitrite reductase specific menaquinol--cytochrome-c reductase (NrfH) precursor [Malonomonas rubra DSM 5091]
MRVVAICSVVAVIGMFFYLVAESKMLSYMSEEPEVCITCHTMNTHYATWQHSSHRGRATCVDCHLPRDSVFNKYMAKARDGFNHSMAMTFKTYGYNLRATDNAAKRIQDNCISCHGNIVSQMLENAKLYSKTESHVQMGRKCWDCHREVPHGITRNLTTTQANLVLD